MSNHANRPDLTDQKKQYEYDTLVKNGNKFIISFCNSIINTQMNN